MSDELGRAVDARIDAFRPDRMPPWDALVDRHRVRGRRRTTTLAVLTAAAAAGIVFVTPALSGGPGRLPNYAGPAPAPATESAARLCARASAEYGGELVAAHAMTVAAVLNHIDDLDRTAGPFRVRDAEWAGKAPDDPAAACYIDAFHAGRTVPDAATRERAPSSRQTAQPRSCCRRAQRRTCRPSRCPRTAAERRPVRCGHHRTPSRLARADGTLGNTAPTGRAPGPPAPVGRRRTRP